MIVVLKNGVSVENLEKLTAHLKSLGVEIHESKGENTTILGLLGDTSRLSENSLLAYNFVEKVIRIQEPYKMVSKKFNPTNTIIQVESPSDAITASKEDPINSFVGEGHFAVMAGPCSVETYEQVTGIARAVKASGATFLRGGAFKPRTSPYAFQGLGLEGIDILVKAKRATGLPIVTELMSIKQLEYFTDVDIIQIGARNMQNFDLLKELGHCGKPILLKRGLANTAKELLMSAEYIMAGGNDKIILCERGIRSFDSFTRNVLDLSVIPYLKKETHLPIIVDPSHATGKAWMVEPMAKAALASGADGLIIEVHNNPVEALCDGDQSITPPQFESLMKKLKQYAALENLSI